MNDLLRSPRLHPYMTRFQREFEIDSCRDMAEAFRKVAEQRGDQETLRKAQDIITECEDLA